MITQDSSVSEVNGYGMDDQCAIPGTGRISVFATRSSPGLCATLSLAFVA